MSLLKDKHGLGVDYNDLIKIEGKIMILREAIDIPMIEIMKYQGYLHLLECEIELFATYEEAIEKYPELYI